MTLIRKLAIKISNEVVIWASPGSKEWAEGLAREVTFIESDWAALDGRSAASEFSLIAAKRRLARSTKFLRSFRSSLNDLSIRHLAFGSRSSAAPNPYLCFSARRVRLRNLAPHSLCSRPFPG